MALEWMQSNFKGGNIWKFGNSIIYGDTGSGNTVQNLIFYSTDNIQFTGGKVCYFEVTFGGGVSLSDFVSSNFEINTPWDDSYNYNKIIRHLTGNDITKLYIPSLMKNSTKVKNLLTFKKNRNRAFGNNVKGIKSVAYEEIDLAMQGYQWVSRSRGWKWSSTSGYGFNNNNKSFNPMGIDGKVDAKYLTLNFLYKFVSLNSFDLTLNEPKNGLKVYMTSINPELFTSIEELVDNSEPIIDIEKNYDYYTKVSINGNRYLLIVADEGMNTDNALRSIDIRGGYHNMTNHYLEISSLDTQPLTVFDGGTFSLITGNGEVYQETGQGPSGSITNEFEINSKIGNGEFRAGIWENGIWNDGYRDDKKVEIFDDINVSYSIYKDKQWTVNIIGPTHSLYNDDDTLKYEIGDAISVGNIVGIDMNDNRKLLKGYYRINQCGKVDENTAYVQFNVNVTFPLKTIRRDSDIHNIYITKNIWLSGAFLNGYFNGIWNNGVFKGFPLISEMNNSQWIDGIFEGGKFTKKYNSKIIGLNVVDDSNKIIIGTASTDVGGLEMTFQDKHYLKKNDKLFFEDIPYTTFVDRVVSDTKVVVRDFEGKNQHTIADVGEYRTEYNIGPTASILICTINNPSLIQNVKLRSLNIAQDIVTNGNFPSSAEVFMYNTWIDVKYDRDSGVNIGRIQNIKDNLFDKTRSINNLYGYPTVDVLSSSSEFRDSYSFINREYKLGTKYKIFNDFVGDASEFNDDFDTSVSVENFVEMGWEPDPISDIHFTDTIDTQGKTASGLTPILKWVQKNYGDTEEYISLDLDVKPNIFEGDYLWVHKNIITKFKNRYRVVNIAKNPKYSGTAVYPWVVTLMGYQYEDTEQNPGTASLMDINKGRYFRSSNEDNISDNNELKIRVKGKGTLLNLSLPDTRIFNRYNHKIEKQRYSIVEFDLINYKEFEYVGDRPEEGKKGTETRKLEEKNRIDFSYTYLTNMDGNESNASSTLSFNNDNKISVVNNDGYDNFDVTRDMTFLPIVENVNHLKTIPYHKIEYFFNKRDLGLLFRGHGINGFTSEVVKTTFDGHVFLDYYDDGHETEFTLSNLKFYEVDMIPFFKYFTYDNINKSVANPYKAISPYIPFEEIDYIILDNSNIDVSTMNSETNKKFKYNGTNNRWVDVTKANNEMFYPKVNVLEAEAKGPNLP